MVPVRPIYLLAPEVVIMSVVCNIEIIRIYLIYLLAPEVVILFVVCNIEVIYDIFDIFVHSALQR